MCALSAVDTVERVSSQPALMTVSSRTTSDGVFPYNIRMSLELLCILQHTSNVLFSLPSTGVTESGVQIGVATYPMWILRETV